MRHKVHEQMRLLPILLSWAALRGTSASEEHNYNRLQPPPDNASATSPDAAWPFEFQVGHVEVALAGTHIRSTVPSRSTTHSEGTHHVGWAEHTQASYLQEP